MTSNSVLNRFEIVYTADPLDDLVLIQIEETNPIVPGNPAIEIFSFEVGSNLVQTSSTNVTNVTGGSVSIMGTQDNTNIYVPPFAIAIDEAGNSQALMLTIERYWLRTNCTSPDYCEGSDFEPDGGVDFADFAVIAEHWLECTNPYPPCNYLPY